MGCFCSKGNNDEDYDSDDSDFEAADLLVGDDDIDPELIANSSMPESFMDLDEDGTGLIEYPEFLKGFGIDDTPLVSWERLRATTRACLRCRRCFSFSMKIDPAVSTSSNSLR